MIEEETVLVCCIDSNIGKMSDGITRFKHEKLWILGDLYNTWGTYRGMDGRYSYQNSLSRLMWEDCIKRRTFYTRYDIHDFEEMMFAINQLRLKERRNRLLIYVGAGTPEFGAAATVMGMMFDEIKVVSTTTSCDMPPSNPLDDTPPDEESYGMSEGKEVEYYKIQRPDLKLLKCLYIYWYEIRDGCRTELNVVRELMRDGVWYELPRKESNEAYDRTVYDLSGKDKNERRLRLKEKNYYIRNVRQKWLENGWVKHSETKYHGLEITKMGERMIRIFGRDSDPEHRNWVLIKKIIERPEPWNDIEGRIECKAYDITKPPKVPQNNQSEVNGID